MKTTARQAGAIYFVFSIMAIIGEFVLPGFVHPGDAAATARAIAGSEATYRLGILVGLATLVLFVFLVASLHKLLRDVDRRQAAQMVLIVTVGVSLALSNLLLRLVPLVVLAGGNEFSAFTGPQLDALAFGALRLHAAASSVVSAFWGLWLFPFGLLVIRSRFLPRILGVLLLLAGCGYLASSVTALAWPMYRHAVSRVAMPLYFGEVPIIFWLLIVGARNPNAPARANARPSSLDPSGPAPA